MIYRAFTSLLAFFAAGVVATHMNPYKYPDVNFYDKDRGIAVKYQTSYDDCTARDTESCNVKIVDSKLVSNRGTYTKSTNSYQWIGYYNYGEQFKQYYDGMSCSYFAYDELYSLQQGSFGDCLPEAAPRPADETQLSEADTAKLKAEAEALAEEKALMEEQLIKMKEAAKNNQKAIDMLEKQAVYLEASLQEYESNVDNIQEIELIMSALAKLDQNLKDLKKEGDDVEGEEVAELQRKMLLQQEQINLILYKAQDNQDDEDEIRPDLFGEAKPPPAHPELFSFKNQDVENTLSEDDLMLILLVLMIALLIITSIACVLCCCFVKTSRAIRNDERRQQEMQYMPGAYPVNGFDQSAQMGIPVEDNYGSGHNNQPLQYPSPIKQQYQLDGDPMPQVGRPSFQGRNSNAKLMMSPQNFSKGQQV